MGIGVTRKLLELAAPDIRQLKANKNIIPRMNVEAR